ncbi:unnamed protein product [Effrenium voratum]|uniref:Ubiquitin-like domain-containing protein n=1 Tax=Effrenium voratum TaxID=2562239 RepID=A0AA36NL52_9DINO|nr:unnamed protein product [Effrenium voratum]
MAPKQSKGYKSSTEQPEQPEQPEQSEQPEDIIMEEEQTTADPNIACGSSEDPLVSQITQSMSEMSLKEMKRALRKKVEEKEELENRMKELTKQLAEDKKKFKELMAPLLEKERLERTKMRREETKKAGHEDRASYINLDIMYKGVKYQINVKKGSSTGKLREKLVELFGLKSKQRLVMDFKGTYVYISNNGKSYGLKRWNTLGVNSGDCINVSLPDTTTTENTENNNEVESAVELNEEENSESESETSGSEKNSEK